jgi:probable rRNA maturation factor
MTKPKPAKSPRRATRTPAARFKDRRPAEIAVLIQDKRWLKSDPRLITLTRRYGRAAFEGAGAAPLAVTVVLSRDSIVRKLNRDFRGKDKPTNVLSFPAPNGVSAPPDQNLPEIGDVILAFETLTNESVTQGKPFVNHLAHLVVHGILHLLGYDHERPGQARVMERLEADILSMLGMPDPYGRGRPRRG